MQIRRPTPTRRRLVGVNVVLALVLVAALAAAYAVIARPASSETASLRTVAVSRGTVTATVNATGNLTSTAVTTVTPGVSGVLDSMAVAAGDVVKKGQVLARIDPEAATAALATARAQYDVALAQRAETAAGQTSASRTKDQLAIASAQLQVDAAEQAVKDSTSTGDSTSGSKASATVKPIAGSSAGSSTQSLAQARQQLAGAKLQLAQARAQAQADAAGPTAAQLAQADAAVASAKVAWQSAKDAVAATTVRAPVSGTVLSVGAAVGDRVSASSASSSGGSSTGSGSNGGSGASSASSSSSSGTSGTTSTSGFVVIADLTSMQVTAQVAEADASAVRAGQSAQVTLSASGDTVDGTVTAVALQGNTSNNVVQYPVTVRLSSVPDGVRLGASANVTITTATRDDVLTVPTSAITTTGAGTTVTLLRGGQQTTVAVTRGLSGGSTTEVSGDIAAGDPVVLPSGSRGSTGVPGPGFVRLGGFSGGAR
jgi:multidrug efflux pump subunit AcrA (membrane-fusion protein)